MRKFYNFCLLFLLCLELSAQSPGGISTNIKFWLAADDVTAGTLVNGTGWTGRGGLPNFTSVSSNPQSISNAINFNNIIEFDGILPAAGNADLVSNGSSLVNGNTVGEVFVVLKQAQNNTFNNGAFTFSGQGGVETAYTSNGTIIERFGILQGDGSFNYNPTNGFVSSGLGNYPTGSRTNNSGVNPKDWNIYNIHAAQNNWQASFNNLVYVALDANNVSFTGATVFIGKGIYFRRPWAGEIAEVINYQRILSAAEKLQVNSYLAIKYGITLGDKNTPTDYKSSAGTSVWFADAAFQNGIFGIGRDNTSLLHQRISKSRNDDSVLTVSTDTNFTSENISHTAIATNNSFLVFGHNNFEMGDFAPYSNSIVANQRSARIWKVVSTGTSLSNVNIRFNDNTVTHMLVSTNPTFSSGVTEVPLVGQVASYNFGSGVTQYVSFAKKINAPGGVYSSSSSMNGVSLKVYNGFDTTPENGFDRTTLLQKGVSSDFYNLDKHLTNESRSNYTISAKSNLSIAATGNYYFQFQTMLTNTAMAIFIDGGLVHNGNGGPLNPDRTMTTPINLTAGTHQVEVVFSKGVNTQSNMQLRWSTLIGGPYTPIPDNLLSINAGSAELLNWYRADMGIANTDGATLTSWQDQSGFNADLVNITGTPKYYNTTATQLFNFNPSVVFDYDKALTTGYSKNVLLNENPRTSFAVTSKTNRAYQYFAGIGGGNSLGNTYFYGIGSDFFKQSIKHFNQNSLSNNTNYLYNNSYISTIAISNPKINPTNNLVGLVNSVSTTTASIPSVATYLSDIGYFSVGEAPSENSTGFNGNVMEVFHYPFVLNNAELNRVQSYLALKYGVSLSEGTGVNYTASNGSTVFWNPATNAGFNTGIFGIGRDDVSVLEQQISKSSRNLSLLTLSTDNNYILPNKSHASIPNNLSFFMVGNNGQDIGYAAYTFGANVSVIMNRKWKVQETGVNISNLHLNMNEANATHLLVSTTPTFNTLVAEVPLVGNSINYDLSNGQYFTFGSNGSGSVPPPSCPDAGNPLCKTSNVLWLKNEAFDINQVKDQMYLQIEAYTKGLAITRVTDPTVDIAIPSSGMLVFDTTDDCLKVYRNSTWSGCILLDQN